MICSASLKSQMLSLNAQPAAKTLRAVRNKGEASENGRLLGKVHFWDPGNTAKAHCLSYKRQMKRPDMDGRTVQPTSFVSLNSLFLH